MQFPQELSTAYLVSVPEQRPWSRISPKHVTITDDPGGSMLLEDALQRISTTKACPPNLRPAPNGPGRES